MIFVFKLRCTRCTTGWNVKIINKHLLICYSNFIESIFSICNDFASHIFQFLYFFSYCEIKHAGF
jgi:hypothetical protein